LFARFNAENEEFQAFRRSFFQNRFYQR
jgi:hypothetical protein